DDEELFAIFADFVDRGDDGMAQGGSGARLGQDARAALRAAQHFLREHLERHATPQPLVVGAVHYAHAAAAELFLDAIVRECASDHVVNDVLLATWRTLQRAAPALVRVPAAPA